MSRPVPKDHFRRKARLTCQQRKRCPHLQLWAAQGYASTQFFVEGLRRAGRDLSTAKFVDTLEHLPPFKAANIPYPMSFTAENHRGITGGYLDGFKDGKHYFFGDARK